MRTITHSEYVDCSCQALYDLVNDIEAYPEFLPWCRRATVYSKSECEQSATLELAVGWLQQAITTRNSMSPGQTIDMVLLRGPFKKFSGSFRFDASEQGGCQVSLRVEYQPDQWLAFLLPDSLVERACQRVIEAFRRRAAECLSG